MQIGAGPSLRLGEFVVYVLGSMRCACSELSNDYGYLIAIKAIAFDLVAMVCTRGRSS